MSKRRKFVIASFLLSLGLLSTQFVTFGLIYRYIAIGALFFVSYLISAWALFEDLKGVEWLVVVPMPGLYAVSVALFYFLLPEALVSKIAVFVVFSLGAYASFLTGNIYSVAAIRTIQLLRAAHAVGFLLILTTSLLFYNTILSFRMPFFVNALLVFLVSFPLVLNGLWSITLELVLSKRLLWCSGVIAGVLAEIMVVLSCLPVTVWIGSLVLVAGMYLLLGLMQHCLQERLFRKTVREYLMVGVFILVVMMMVTPWR